MPVYDADLRADYQSTGGFFYGVEVSSNGRTYYTEAEDLEFHKKLREAYLAIAAEEPQRCVVIDASGGRETVARLIWNIVGARLDPMTAPLAGNVGQEVGA